MTLRTWLAAMVVLLVLGCGSAVAAVATGKAASTPAAGAEVSLPSLDLQKPAGVSSVVQWIVLITLLSIAPAIVVMVTSFTRIIVVLGLLRQALATQQTPPNQILFGLALFMTAVVMAPVYHEVHRDAIEPLMSGKMASGEARHAGEGSIRKFMSRQIEAGGNSDDVYVFLNDETAAKKDLKWSDVPTLSLIPAYVVSELKIAFLMGFRIYLPFLIIDMLVSSVLISMGMLMLPPVLISLPFKLLLFVLSDGWQLVVGTLMNSFR
jgi:flagellar biosynthetic protein FliP